MSRAAPLVEALSEVSDAQLFRDVADGDALTARRARGELYQRHVRYLYAVLAKRCGKLLETCGSSAEDLVQETFHRAFERAHTHRPVESTDPETERRRTRAWLGRIARNLLADSLRSEREVSASPYVERAAARDSDVPSRPSERVAQMQEALASLSDREQDILRVTALYAHEGAHQRLPNDVSKTLAERWGTSNDNIRAIRRRALQKVRAWFAERGYPPEEAS